MQELQLVKSDAAYLVLIGVGALDSWLLYRFFSGSVKRTETPERFTASEGAFGMAPRTSVTSD